MVTWSITSNSRRCRAAIAIETARMETISTGLIFRIFPPSFFNEDLDSFLRQKREHDQRTQSVSAAEVSAGVEQQRDQEDQRKIGIAEREDRRGFQRLIAQLDREGLQVRTDDGYDQHRQSRYSDAHKTAGRPLAKPQLATSQPEHGRRCGDVTIAHAPGPPTFAQLFKRAVDAGGQ